MDGGCLISRYVSFFNYVRIYSGPYVNFDGFFWMVIIITKKISLWISTGTLFLLNRHFFAPDQKGSLIWLLKRNCLFLGENYCFVSCELVHKSERFNFFYREMWADPKIHKHPSIDNMIYDLMVILSRFLPWELIEWNFLLFTFFWMLCFSWKRLYSMQLGIIISFCYCPW